MQCSMAQLIKRGVCSSPAKILANKNFCSTRQLNKAYKVTSHDEFLEKVMHSEKPVIVNFHAEWCEPCKILTPKLNAMIDAMETIDLAVVDVEQNAELVHTFEVKAVPAVIAVRDGVVVDKFIGLVDADMIDNLVRKLSKKV